MKRYKQIAMKVRLLEIRQPRLPTTTSITTLTRSAGIQTADISTEGLPVGPVDDLEKNVEEIRTTREDIKSPHNGY